jgi:hypothetical protein
VAVVADNIDHSAYPAFWLAMSPGPAKRLLPAGLPASSQADSSMDSEQPLGGDGRHPGRKQKRVAACKECRQAKVRRISSFFGVAMLRNMWNTD